MRLYETGRIVCLAPTSSFVLVTDCDRLYHCLQYVRCYHRKELLN